MKFIFSLLVAVIVGSLSCSAADLDSSDYYSLSPVMSLSPTVNSALDYSVQPLDLSTSESNWLMGIWQGVTQTSSLNGGSLLYNVQQLRTAFSSFAGMNFWTYVMDDVESIRHQLATYGNDTIKGQIDEIFDELSNVYLSTSYSALSLEEINDAIQNDSDSLQALLTAIWGDTEDILTNTSSLLSGFSSYSSWWQDRYIFNLKTLSPDGFITDSVVTIPFRAAKAVTSMAVQLGYEGFSYDDTGSLTLFSYIKRLANVLASEDDLALANSQKANREEIESEFLTGSSGSTSLGVSDFGDLADVGGTIKDSLSLDGNATIGSFTSGLAAADSAGQGWFSEETRSQLDAVSSTVTYSLRDPDPYNMAGWEDRYYWLLGDDE